MSSETEKFLETGEGKNHGHPGPTKKELVSAKMKKHWQDPKFRTRILKAQRKALDERMKRRFLETARGED